MAKALSRISFVMISVRILSPRNQSDFGQSFFQSCSNPAGLSKTNSLAGALPVAPASRYAGAIGPPYPATQKKKMTRADAIANARQLFASGEFLKTLERRVAYRT